MKKIKSSLFLSIILIVTLSSALYGCSDGKVQNAGKDEGVATVNDEKITLTLWYWSRSIDDNLIKEVSKQFPNITIEAEKIGGDFKAKLMTTLAAGSGGPDIVAMNDWVAELFPNKDQFVNLMDFGSDQELQSLYLDWKWQQTMTPDGNYQIALPMDTGPTALFYREDMFAQADLPTDPNEVSATIKTWDDYFGAGQKLQTALGDQKVFMFDNMSRVFTQVLSQSDKLYFDAEDNFIGDQEHVKRAWDFAVNMNQMGLNGKIDAWSPEWSAAMNNNAVASFVGAVWMKQVLSDAAPDTAGKWRIAKAPGGDGNNGGSFIAITKQSKHPKEAYEVIKWMMNPQHQLNSLVTTNLFPSTPSIYSDPKMIPAEDFFGGQKTNEFFIKSAENVKLAYRGPKFSIVNTTFGEELINVEKQNKDPEKAWQDAIDKIKKELSR